jgi:hypothetical protein
MRLVDRPLPKVKRRGPMREINLASYKVKIKESKGGKLVDRTDTYNVKDSLISILFMPGNGVTARESFKRQVLADKIEAADKTVMIEEADWMKLVEAAEKIENVGRNDIEFMHRILDAPEVKVEKVEKVN